MLVRFKTAVPTLCGSGGGGEGGNVQSGDIKEYGKVKT